MTVGRVTERKTFIDSSCREDNLLGFVVAGGQFMSAPGEMEHAPLSLSFSRTSSKSRAMASSIPYPKHASVSYNNSIVRVINIGVKSQTYQVAIVSLLIY